MRFGVERLSDGRAIRALVADAQPARIAWASQRCGTGQAAYRWVKGSRDLERIVKRAQSADVGASEAKSPTLNDDRRRAVLIALGQRPTPGYAIALREPGVRLTDKTLRLRVAVKSPDPDSLRAQVVTQPCAIVAVPRGPHERLEIIDADGSVRAQLSLP